MNILSYKLRHFLISDVVIQSNTYLTSFIDMVYNEFYQFILIFLKAILKVIQIKKKTNQACIIYNFMFFLILPLLYILYQTDAFTVVNIQRYLLTDCCLLTTYNITGKISLYCNFQISLRYSSCFMFFNGKIVLHYY